MRPLHTLASLALPAIATLTSTGAAAQSITYEICAKAGSVTMTDGAVVPIWGFATRPAALPCSDPSVAAGLPGPVLEVTAGDAVSVTLYNELTEPVSIVFPGQQIYPDLAGVPPGGSSTYLFTASAAGTFRYESAVNAPIQVPMGLYGALVVRPATAGRAYAGASSAYDREAVLVLSEIDAGFNADPTPARLMTYRPRYWLINGTSYPAIPMIAASAGERVLLRYVNAGQSHLTMALLGGHQQIIAGDAFELRYPSTLIAHTIAAGQTADAIVDLPDGVSGVRVPLFARQLQPMTTGAVASPAHFPGGMLTFIDVGTPPLVAAGSTLTASAASSSAAPMSCAAAGVSPAALFLLAAVALLARRRLRRAPWIGGLAVALGGCAERVEPHPSLSQRASDALRVADGLEVRALRGDRAEVRWAAVPGAAGYRVFAQRDGRGRGLQLKADVPAPATASVIEGLTAGAGYRLWVAPYDAAGAQAPISGAQPTHLVHRPAP